MSKKQKDDGKTPRETFNLRAKPGQVIPYSQADEDLQKRMKKEMAAIKEAPDSFEALMGYGSRPMAKLGRVANRMVGLQQKFSAVATNVGNELDKLNNGAPNIDLDAFAKSTQDALKSLSTKGKMPPASAPGQQMLQNAMDQLPVMAQQVVDIEKALKKSDKAIGNLLDEARRIDRQRRDATREIGIAIGAGEKLSEKFDGKFLKKAVKRLKKDFSPENKARLKDVLKRGPQFQDRLEVLEASRAAAKIARSQMRQMTEMMQEQRAKISEITGASAQEWKVLLKSAGIALDGAAKKPKTGNAPKP